MIMNHMITQSRLLSFLTSDIDLYFNLNQTFVADTSVLFGRLDSWVSTNTAVVDIIQNCIQMYRWEIPCRHVCYSFDLYSQ